MTRAAIALHKATGSARLSRPRAAMADGARPPLRQLQQRQLLLTADDAEGLVVRPDSTVDEATPNPNGVAAQDLVRLAMLAGDNIWRERADILFDGLLPAAAESMYLHASLINALDLRLRAVEIVAVGPQADRFAEAALALPFPDRIVGRAARTEDLPAGHPARAVPLGEAQTAALVCAGETCSLPLTDVEQLGAAVAAARAPRSAP